MYSHSSVEIMISYCGRFFDISNRYTQYSGYELCKYVMYFLIHYLLFVCKDIRYGTWLRAGRSGDRIPVVARFSAPVQTGPGVHPASYKMGTRSFAGFKRPGRGVDKPPH